MRWFRTKRRSGSTLALMALAVQLLVSLTHSHGTVGPRHPVAAPPVAASAALVASVFKASLSHAASAADEGACDVCALLSLTRIADQAAVPPLAIPVSVTAASFAAAVDPPFVARWHHSPQARAPPTV